MIHKLIPLALLASPAMANAQTLPQFELNGFRSLFPENPETFCSEIKKTFPLTKECWVFDNPTGLFSDMKPTISLGIYTKGKLTELTVETIGDKDKILKQLKTRYGQPVYSEPKGMMWHFQEGILRVFPKQSSTTIHFQTYDEINRLTNRNR
jgi:hypothetical protein